MGFDNVSSEAKAMGERPTVETQENDFRGEIALDISSDPRAPNLFPRAGWDHDRFPVVGYRFRKFDGNVQLSVICLDKSAGQSSAVDDTVVPLRAREFRLDPTGEMVWDRILRLDVVVAAVPLDKLIVETSIPDRSN